MARLRCLSGIQVRALCRSRQQGLDILGSGDNLKIIEGSLGCPESLRNLLEAGCTVINLAYLWNRGETENLTVTSKLVSACKDKNIKRMKKRNRLFLLEDYSLITISVFLP